MKTNSNRVVFARLLCGVGCLLTGCSAPTATRTSTGQVGGAELIAVFSRTRKDYVRAQNPDGSFKPETYIFKNGGDLTGPRHDATIDRLTFDQVSNVIAGPLAGQSYVPSEHPSKTNLLIVVFWGTTVVPGDVDPYDGRESETALEQRHVFSNAQIYTNSPGAEGWWSDASNPYPANVGGIAQAQMMEGGQDAVIDAKSANILGYTDEIQRTSPRDSYRKSLKSEIEDDRYYVVLQAYDYQLARNSMQHKLLWETRFSIPERGNDFEKAFPMMASIAGSYFGKDSNGLVHHELEAGHVEIGEPKSLGTLPEK